MQACVRDWACLHVWLSVGLNVCDWVCDRAVESMCACASLCVCVTYTYTRTQFCKRTWVHWEKDCITKQATSYYQQHHILLNVFILQRSCNYEMRDNCMLQIFKIIRWDCVIKLGIMIKQEEAVISGVIYRTSGSGLIGIWIPPLGPSHTNSSSGTTPDGVTYALLFSMKGWRQSILSPTIGGDSSAMSMMSTNGFPSAPTRR